MSSSSNERPTEKLLMVLRGLIDSCLACVFPDGVLSSNGVSGSLDGAFVTPPSTVDCACVTVSIGRGGGGDR